MSGITVNLATDADLQKSTRAGMFVKVAAFPASDMTLMDIDASTTASIRFKMSSNGHLWAEGVYGGVTLDLDLTPSGTTIDLEYWITLVMGSEVDQDSHHSKWNLKAQAWGPGGVTAGQMNAYQDAILPNGGFTARLGWGVNRSISYLPFPNTVGNELSKLAIQALNHNTDGQIWSPPGSDFSPSGLEVLYLCRDALGAQSTIADSTTNARTMTAGGQGMTVNLDGPYP